MTITSASSLIWDSKLYDDKHAFVFKYGEDLLKLLSPEKGELIIDLGCGTGHLTNKITEFGATAIGMDKSAEMIAVARQTYPTLQFEQQDATRFKWEQPVDAVFLTQPYTGFRRKKR